MSTHRTLPNVRPEHISGSIRFFNVSVDLLPDTEVLGVTYPSHLDPASYNRPPTRGNALPRVERTVERILREVPGIFAINVLRRHFQITIVGAFKWRELEAPVSAIIENELFGARLPVVLPSRGRLRYRRTSSDHVMQYQLTKRLTLLQPEDGTFTEEHEICSPIPRGHNVWLRNRQPVDETGRKLINRMLKTVPGILEVLVRPHQLNVKFAAIVDLDEVNPMVLSLIRDEVFGDQSFDTEGDLGQYGEHELIYMRGEELFQQIQHYGFRRIRPRETNSDLVTVFGVSDRLLLSENWNDGCVVTAPITKSADDIEREELGEQMQIGLRLIRSKQPEPVFRLNDSAIRLVNWIFGAYGDDVVEIRIRGYELHVKTNNPAKWGMLKSHIVSSIIKVLFDDTQQVETQYAA